MSAETKSIPEASAARRARGAFQGPIMDSLAEIPWWALFILLAGAFFAYNFITNQTYSDIIVTLSEGIYLTILITITAYFFAILIGLTTALMRLSQSIVLRNIAQLYVQVVRGVPILVQIIYWVVVVFPLFLVPAINNLGTGLAYLNILGPENALITFRVSNIVRGIIALAFSYGAFSSEIFRAGIQSIERGQREAASALGLKWYQSFRFIILPQALRRVLPPLGNDFIAMLKESSLLSAIGIGEITQLSKKYAAASFLFLQTYNTAAFLYLSMTLLLSMGVKYMEQRLRSDQRAD